MDSSVESAGSRQAVSAGESEHGGRNVEDGCMSSLKGAFFFALLWVHFIFDWVSGLGLTFSSSFTFE